jgi:hypothetical protein
MLVHFDSKAGGFTMFGDIAVELLKMMGHSGTVPSAILAADIPVAVERLRQALRNAAPPPAELEEATDQHGDKKEPRISLQTRAVPLIDLLERAAARGADVTWR